jgi:short-subunit dehydrogenase
MRRALIVGGANGIGLSIATELALRPDTERVYIVDKATVKEKYWNEKFQTFTFDLTQEDYSLFDQFHDIDTLMLTAGWGRLALFKDLTESDITAYFHVNTLPVMRLIKRFYPKLEGKEDFYCGVMVSIAGFMSSPFFSVYAATKAALRIFIESVNVELLKSGSSNQILNVSPGSIQGTSFQQKETDLALTSPLAKEIIQHLEQKDDLFIPQYEEVFKNVLARYQQDFRAEGLHSYDYKLNSGRIFT